MAPESGRWEILGAARSNQVAITPRPLPQAGKGNSGANRHFRHSPAAGVHDDNPRVQGDLRMRVLFCIVGLAMSLPAISVPAMAEKLTIDRIYSDPDLNGPSPRALKPAPDGSRVTFLRGREDDQNQLDLWMFEVATNTTRRLVDSTALGKAAELSDAEKARRERERIAQLHGIVSYRWSPDTEEDPVRRRRAALALRSRGQARRRAARADAERPGRDRRAGVAEGPLRLVRQPARISTRSISSPAQNYQLTRDGKGPIHNAEAEFVAQEEMERATGYWWAPDDSLIAFEHFDESGVDEIKRNEVYADRTETMSQRYPAAGRPNVTVQLGLVRPHDMRMRWVELGTSPSGKGGDIYLARVELAARCERAFVPARDARSAAARSRRSRRGQPAARTVLTETNTTWINLNDDLRFLKHEDAFVWASEQSGHKHLYVIGLDGKQRRALTTGRLGRGQAARARREIRHDLFQRRVAEIRCSSRSMRRSLDGSDAASPRADQRRRRLARGRVRRGRSGVHRYLFRSGDAAAGFAAQARRQADRVDRAEHAQGRPSVLAVPRQPDRARIRLARRPRTARRCCTASTSRPISTRRRSYPVFMTYYGGPGRQYVNRAWGNHFEQYMAQHGYVVFALDNRGSPRRGRAFSDAIFRQLGKAEVADQLAGVAWLQAAAVRRRRSHRRLRLELRRLHDADAARRKDRTGSRPASRSRR